MRSLERRSPTSAARRRRGSRRARRRRSTSTKTRVREWLGPRRSRGESASARPSPVSRPASPTRRSAATCSSSRRPRTRARQADDHRPARRGDAGVRAGGALLGARAHATSSACPTDWFAEHDIHIHVPAGAVPKDGPSAGVTMATAIVSLVARQPGRRRRRHDRRDHATGQVLPIGGVREKVARRAAGGPEARDPAARERARPRGAPGGDARRAQFVLGTPSRRFSRRPSTGSL